MTNRTWLEVLAGGAVVALLATGCSRSAETSVQRGDAALAKGDVAAAVLEYRNAVDKDALLAPARQKLGEAYMRQGNTAGALAEYVRAADLLPRDVDAQIKAGTLLGLARLFDQAKARADKALALEPKNVDALVLRANALASLTDLEGGLRQMQEALSLDPRASIQTGLGAIEMMRGNLPEAEQAFRKAVATDPKSVTAQIALGQFLWNNKNLPDAEAAFKAAVTLQPGAELTNQWMAAFFLGTGRAPDAEPFLKKVAESSTAASGKVALADYYVGMERPADGIAMLERLSSEPRFWPLARAKIAEIQFAQGKRADAMRTVTEVVSKHPTMAQARVVRGQLLLGDKRLDQALADGREALKLDPQNISAHFLLGAVQEARQDLDAAAAAFGEVLRLNPRASTAQVRLAMVEMKRNAMPAATRLAEQAASAQPDNLLAQVVLARALLANGELDRSTAITARLLEVAPDSAVVQNQVGMLALARKDKAAARGAFEKALAREDRVTESLVALAALDIEDGQGQRARERIEQRLTASPRDSALLAIAGRIWAATGDLSKGEQLLRRAIDVDASNFEAYSQLAQLYVGQGKMDQAIAEFDRLAAKQPKSVPTQTLAAMIFQAQGKEEEARKRLERVIDVDPRAAVASNNLAWIYASRGEQLDRALQLAQAAKAELPDHPEVNDTLAFVYIKKKLPSLAIPPLKIALEKDPRNAAFHYHLGVAYADAGNNLAARESLLHALKLKSDFDGAEDARKRLASLN